MSNKCAPNRYNSKNNTCFRDDEIIEMSKAYNRYVSKQKLSPERLKQYGSAELIEINDDVKILLEKLKKRFENICSGDEQCITKQAFMNEIVVNEMREFFDDAFRPKGPNDPKEWLSTDDINGIMEQYRHVYPDFMFLGAVPLDCNDLSFCSLYKINFDEHINKNINRIGIIFNLDKHGEPGSHWVALYINIANGEIFFCDSMGKKPIENIVTVINDFKEYYKKKSRNDVIYKYNTQRYQKDGSECGIYSCNFLIRILAGEPYEKIIENYLDFTEINSCRNVYFYNNPSKYKSHKLCDPAHNI